MVLDWAEQRDVNFESVLLWETDQKPPKENPASDWGKNN